MPLVVEDGSIIANANSYNSLVDIKAFAEARQRTLPDDDTLIEAYAIRAMDYLESFRSEYKGEKTGPTLDPIEDQSLEFPRTDFGELFSIELGENEIPEILKIAHMQLTVDVANGVELQPVLIMTDRVKRKRVGPLETEWFDGYSTGVAPQITYIDNMLAPLLNPSSFGLKTLRV